MRFFKSSFFILLFLAVISVNAQQHVKFFANPSKLSVKAGEEFQIQFKIVLDKHWYTYSTKEQVGPDGVGPTATEIKLKENDLLAQNGKLIVPKGKVKFDEGFRTKIEYFKENATFVIPVKAKKAINFAKDQLFVNVFIQICDTARCLPPEEYNVKIDKKAVEIEIAKVDTTASTQSESTTIGQENSKNTQDHTTSPNQNISKKVETESQKEYNDAIKGGVSSFIWLAFIAGLISLLTPCVFPMVPITVSFFTKRAEKAHGKGLRDSLVFALGIISTFTLLGVIFSSVSGGAGGLSSFAANGWFNLAIAIVIFILALNLFGAFEIQVPTSIMNKLNNKSQGNGLLAIFLMGLTFSLTSFTCTVPFVSFALGSAANGKWFYPILGMLVYSSVFAAPFFLLSLFPRALKSLPKSGGWMNNIKVVFGFLEIAFAIKFISQADVAWGLEILPREVFLAAWIACFALATLYIFGFFEMKMDSKLEKVGGVRALFGFFFATITVYLFYGLGGNTFFNDLNSYMPPYSFNTSNVSNVVAGSAKVEEVWESDYKKALTRAKAENKNVFIDFTGWTCTNCRWMEQNIFPDKEVSELMSKFVLVRLYTDRREVAELANKKMQMDRYGTIELPLYVIVKPNEELIGTKTFSRDKAAFITFLKKGL